MRNLYLASFKIVYTLDKGSQTGPKSSVILSANLVARDEEQVREYVPTVVREYLAVSRERFVDSGLGVVPVLSIFEIIEIERKVTDVLVIGK